MADQAQWEHDIDETKGSHSVTSLPHSQQLNRIFDCSDYYEALGVTSSATQDDLKSAYVQLG